MGPGWWAGHGSGQAPLPPPVSSLHRRGQTEIRPVPRPCLGKASRITRLRLVARYFPLQTSVASPSISAPAPPLRFPLIAGSRLFAAPGTRAAESRGADRLLGPLLLAAAAALLAGWLLPVMTVRTLLVFYDEVSILTGALRLLESGDVALFLVIRSEEHTSELQSLMRISYAVFCLKKKT